jgi:hypothetical protein
MLLPPLNSHFLYIVKSFSSLTSIACRNTSANITVKSPAMIKIIVIITVRNELKKMIFIIYEAAIINAEIAMRLRLFTLSIIKGFLLFKVLKIFLNSNMIMRQKIPVKYMKPNRK